MKHQIKFIELEQLQDLTRSLRKSKDEETIRTGFIDLLEHYDLYNCKLSYNRPIWRARLCEKETGFENMAEIYHPSPEKADINRLNEKGEPIFYAAFSNFTALEEVGAKDGDVVHLSGFIIDEMNKLRCCYIGEVLSTHRSGKSLMPQGNNEYINKLLNKLPPAIARSYVFIDAFFDSILRDPNAKSNGYIHSRILAKLLLNKSQGVDCIFYQSVALNGAVNLAIKVDRLISTIRPVGNSVIKIKKRYNFGIYDFEILRNSTKYNDDGTIIWN